MANAVAFLPQTPVSTRSASSQNDHRPTKSSPLAPVSFPPSSSPGPVSPVAEVQARRRGQYKSRAPSSSSVASLRSKARFKNSPATPIPFTLGPVTADAGHAAFLRERFRADCFERARRAREKGVLRRRASATSDASSDGFDDDMNIDVGEGDDAEDNSGFDDELFRRVIANEKRKRAHAYALSFELDVGSSFDPAMEDPTSWEEQLCASPSQSQSSRHQIYKAEEDQVPLPPEDIEDVPDFDEFDLDEDSAWVDEYIASLPLDSIEAQLATTSDARHNEVGREQMDVTMG